MILKALTQIYLSQGCIIQSNNLFSKRHKKFHFEVELFEVDWNLKWKLCWMTRWYLCHCPGAKRHISAEFYCSPLVFGDHMWAGDGHCTLAPRTNVLAHNKPTYNNPRSTSCNDSYCDTTKVQTHWCCCCKRPSEIKMTTQAGPIVTPHSMEAFSIGG